MKSSTEKPRLQPIQKRADTPTLSFMTETVIDSDIEMSEMDTARYLSCDEVIPMTVATSKTEARTNSPDSICVRPSGFSNWEQKMFIIASAITMRYYELVSKGGFDASFHRGQRNIIQRRSPRFGQPVLVCQEMKSVRTLATAFLSNAATDGHNVVVGAIELARVWCVDEAVCSNNGLLDNVTRMRLAICLYLSWKFQRWNETGFRAMYKDEGGVPRSLDLAVISFTFMYTWEINAPCRQSCDSARKLQEELVRMEFELVMAVPVLRLLNNNAQIEAEMRLASMLSEIADVIAARAIVPLFYRAMVASKGNMSLELCSMNTYKLGGGMACLAFMVLWRTDAATARAVEYFSCEERSIAATVAWEVAVCDETEFIYSGCYGDKNWFLAEYITPEKLEKVHKRLKVIETSVG
jgi:hypothetical protein